MVRRSWLLAFADILFTGGLGAVTGHWLLISSRADCNIEQRACQCFREGPPNVRPKRGRPKCCTTATLLFQPRRKEPVSTGLILEAFLWRLKGLTGRRARRRGARAFTGDYQRMGQKTISCITADGRLGEGGGRGRGGRGTGAERLKRCMSSCDALLCILSCVR